MERFDQFGRRHRPSLLRFLLVNALIGAFVAVIVVIGLMVSDAHLIGTLIFQSEHPWLPIVMLLGAFIVTFGSISMGCAVMALPYGKDDGNDGGGRRRSERPMTSMLIPSPIHVSGTRRRN